MNEAETRAEHIDPVLRAAGRGRRLRAGLPQHQAGRSLHLCHQWPSHYGIDMDKGLEGDLVAYPSPDERWAQTFADAG